MGALVTEESLIWLQCKNSWGMRSLLCGFGEIKNVPLVLGQQLQV